jgi:hypothetical protein
MTGSTTAVVVIPIVAFLLLISWLSMVYYADSHPYWRGRQPVPQQRMTFLPNTAEVMGANPPASELAGAGSAPAAESQAAGRADSAEAEPATQPLPAVPGQRPAPAGQPVATAGATQAATGARPRHR